MALTIGRYSVYEVEVTSDSEKKMLLLIETDDYASAWCRLWHSACLNSGSLKKYQMIERDDIGMLYVRMDVFIDGRPFCESPEDMGPEKFGYNL
jgi:hypothetical protein